MFSLGAGTDFGSMAQNPNEGGDSIGSMGKGASMGSAAGPWGAAIGALVGLLKGELIDAPAKQRQAGLAAKTVLYSPWTGMAADTSYMKAPGTFESALSGAGAGMATGQSYADAQRRAKRAEMEDKIAQGYLNDRGWRFNSSAVKGY